MKKLIFSAIFLTTCLYGYVFAGPADTATYGGNTIIRNSKIQNEAVINRLKIKAVGRNQKVSVGSMKIKRGTKIENANLKNKTVIKNANIEVRGSGQNIDVGNFEISKWGL